MHMRRPLFSIITPNYNSVSFIEETLKSVIAQKRDLSGQLEFIVVDGASTDGSLDIISQYKSEIDVLIVEPDGGQVEAINKGLKRARGNWLAYLNSDDLYVDGVLEKLAQLIAFKPELRWISAGTQKFGESGNYDVGMTHLPEKGRCIDWVSYGANCPQPSTFWHRQVTEKVGVFDPEYHFAFDTEYWLRIYAAGFRPLIVDEVWAKFRIHEASKTGTSRMGFLDEHEKFMQKHRSLFEKKEMDKASEILRRLRAESTVYEIDWSKKEWIQSLKRAIELSPHVLMERFFWGAFKKGLMR